MIRGKFLTLTSVALGSYFAGRVSERFYGGSKTEHALNENEDVNILRMPGLPIFGTVSAASLVPSKPNFDEPKCVPPEPALNAPRVSQVLFYYFS